MGDPRHGNASSARSGTGITKMGEGIKPPSHPFYLRLLGKGCEFNFVLVLHKYPLLS